MWRFCVKNNNNTNNNNNKSGIGVRTVNYTPHFFQRFPTSQTWPLFFIIIAVSSTQSRLSRAPSVWAQSFGNSRDWASNQSACCSVRGQAYPCLTHTTVPAPVQHWRRLQGTRVWSFNPFLDPIIQFHFHGRSCWVCYWITHAKKRAIFSGTLRKWSSRRRELLARRAGCFPWTSCCF